MGWYTCNKKGHSFHSGILKRTYCPVCYNARLQIRDLIKHGIKIIIITGIILVILHFAVKPIQKRIVSTAFAALDSTTLYAYSKDAYLESIIRGKMENSYFTITKTTPYYSSILTRAQLENEEEPLGELSRGAVVELRSIIRRGENVWIPAFFYIQDKPQLAFVLFPRDWEESVTVYDREESAKAINTAYDTYIRKNFELMKVERKDEKEYKEKYNDYFKVRGLGDKNTFYYAQKTDKAVLDRIYTYYLSANNINMVILQTDRGWKRPDFVITKEEEN
jgi:hypothetical protein